MAKKYWTRGDVRVALDRIIDSVTLNENAPYSSDRIADSIDVFENCWFFHGRVNKEILEKRARGYLANILPDMRRSGTLELYREMRDTIKWFVPKMVKEMEGAK